ncbi:hypothetical protein I541_5666 [Mycobacteroides abscessus]|nr:hypothetical protein I541_5666 [Mycobacteroides abscessus]
MVLTTTRTRPHLGRQALDLYLGLTNYLTMLEAVRRQHDDLVKPAATSW